MATRKLHVTCPDCRATLVVDADTGEVLGHHTAKEPAGGGHVFDSLLRGLDEGRARAEAVFEREKAAVRDRQRLLDEKFAEAMRRADEEGDEAPPPRPFDFD